MMEAVPTESLPYNDLNNQTVRLPSPTAYAATTSSRSSVPTCVLVAHTINLNVTAMPSLGICGIRQNSRSSKIVRNQSDFL